MVNGVLLKGQDKDIEIDAEVIANGLGLSVTKLQAEMRNRRVTSRFERGADEDQGRLRLTFSFDHRQFQMITDEMGRLIKSSSINFRKPLSVKEKP